MTNIDFYKEMKFRRAKKVQQLVTRWKNGASIVSQPSMYYPANTIEVPLPAGVDGRFPQGTKWEGSAIIARRRILETGTRFLTKTPECTDTNLRATQLASFDVTSQDPRFSHRVRHAHLLDHNVIFIFNTHFGLDGPCLWSNVQETIEYMAPHASNRLVLLVGDMNATPDHPALQLLRDAGYVDLWDKLHPNPITQEDLGFTFPSDKPIKRIDFGWANKLLADYVCNITIIGNTPNPDGTYASDHYGLQFTFDL
jgi:endonuclease/exonuclease/phosphatase family metal-dependent hydrolase